MRQHLALKPPFWLLSLPLFLVLYRNTASQPWGEDDDCEGDVEDKRDDRDGDVEDEIGDVNREEKIEDDLEDKKMMARKLC